MLNIAIDGPSGAGKSSLARLISKRLNITYLDTGAMYRAAALKAMSLGVDVTDEKAVEEVLPSINVLIKYENGEQKVYVDGKDVSSDIREHKISKGASDISRHPNVRRKLVELQRDIAKHSDIVLDGRDITSYVLPNATYKFYIDASPEVRAKRRIKDLEARGESVALEKLIEDIKQRDYNDSHRPFAPLVRTQDSHYIDTSNMTLDEVLDRIMSIIEEK